MPRLAVPIDSDAIRSIEYVFSLDKLFVEFNSGQVYHYDHVPVQLYQLLVDAQATQTSPNRVSVGSLFHYTIRMHPTQYPFDKLSQEELQQLDQVNSINILLAAHEVIPAEELHTAHPMSSPS